MASIDKLGWLRVENRRVLMVRSRGQQVYYIPGGKREAGETDQQALVREIGEELNVQLAPENLEYLDTFEAQAHGKPEGTLVRIACYGGDYTGVLKPASEIDDMAWLGHADRPRVGGAAVLIFDWLKQINRID
ncbi:MAG TPA: NUDIX domain-containing protein [Alphaproteobacteria bacterium]|nr:NUDIX domain-containing protein [Alphaproteobacteria bacterium]